MKKKLWLVISVVVALLAFALYRVVTQSIECARAATAERILDRLNHDPGPAEADRAVTSLTKLGEPAIKPLITHLGTGNSVAEQALANIGAPAIDPLRRVLRTSSDERIRFSALWALGRNEDPRSIGILIAAFRDRSDYVGQSAALILRDNKRDKAIIGPLLVAIKDPDRQVRMYSAKALYQTHDPRAVTALLEMLQNRKEWPKARCEAATSLGHIGGDRAVNALARVIREKTDCIRVEARDALVQMSTLAARHALRALLSDKDPSLRRLVHDLFFGN